MKKEMSKMDVQAKMDVLKELYDMCSDSLKSKVKGGMDEMKSVTVSAPDSESLEEGLEMAADLAPEMEEEKPEMKSEEKPEMESEEEDESGGSFLDAIRRKKMAKEY